VRPPRSEASVRIVSTRIGGDSLLEWCPIVPTATVTSSASSSSVSACTCEGSSKRCTVSYRPRDAFLIVTPLVMLGSLVLLRGRGHVGDDRRRAADLAVTLAAERH